MILPYAWEFYQHGGGLLSDADLNTSIALPKELGADGVVIWGSLHLQSAATQADYWKHLKDKTGLLVRRIHAGDTNAAASMKGDDELLPTQPDRLPAADDGIVVPITTEAAMCDSRGAPIRDCLMPHIRKHGGTYYAHGFGIPANATADQRYQTTYSSPDLLAWTNADVPAAPPGGSPSLDVIFHPKTKLFVSFGEDYGHSFSSWTAPTALGPFTKKQDMTPGASVLLLCFFAAALLLHSSLYSSLRRPWRHGSFRRYRRNRVHHLQSLLWSDSSALCVPTHSGEYVYTTKATICT